MSVVTFRAAAVDTVDGGWLSASEDITIVGGFTYAGTSGRIATLGYQANQDDTYSFTITAAARTELNGKLEFIAKGYHTIIEG